MNLKNKLFISLCILFPILLTAQTGNQPIFNEKKNTLDCYLFYEKQYPAGRYSNQCNATMKRQLKIIQDRLQQQRK